MSTVRRYRALDIEYAALKVVGRGLFLIVMLMVVFLYIFARATDVIDGANEVLIPTVAVMSAGIVLVFALLLWVNICVRAYLAALCWVGLAPTDLGQPANSGQNAPPGGRI